MSWKKSNDGEMHSWEHPAWAAYFRNPNNLPFVEVDMTKGTKGLNGYRPPRLGPVRVPESKAGAKYQRDFLAGRVTIPGLKVSIKTADGVEFGACKPITCGDPKKIKPAPKVKLDS
jgi:hypothetical protein